MKVIEYAYQDGISLVEARKLTDEEKKDYTEEWQDSVLIATGESVQLDHISWEDLDEVKRREKYAFNGCGNRAYEISDAEWDAFLALDGERAASRQAEDDLEYADGLRAIIAQAEAQRDIPTKEEAARRAAEYNSVNNEGGDGYVPRMVTAEQYLAAKEALANLEEDAK